MATTSKIVLILGAGANIGQGVARAFASQGYKVVSTSRSAENVDSSFEGMHITADLSNPESVAGVFSQVKTSLGVPSVVVYNGSPHSSKHQCTHR
jgi:NAD(P)-dependent dehydrogenase (short-subunit alcohol dehydrogenase family)